MFKKISRVVLGVLIGLILITLAWYLVSGLTASQDSQTDVASIKDDLLSNPVVNQVQERLSVVNYPITVSGSEIGVKDPFK